MEGKFPFRIHPFVTLGDKNRINILSLADIKYEWWLFTKLRRTESADGRAGELNEFSKFSHALDKELKILPGTGVASRERKTLHQENCSSSRKASQPLNFHNFVLLQADSSKLILVVKRFILARSCLSCLITQSFAGIRNTILNIRVLVEGAWMEVDEDWANVWWK